MKKKEDNKTKNIFVKHELPFDDSFKFMATSLDSLASNLPNNMFNNLSFFYEEQDNYKEKLKLLKRKGVYPYDYMDCFEKLSETTLPPTESFYSELNIRQVRRQLYPGAKSMGNI